MTLCPGLAQPCHVGLPASRTSPPALLPSRKKKTPLKFFQATVTKPQPSDRHFPGSEQPPVLPSSCPVAPRDPSMCQAAVVLGTPLHPLYVSGPHLIPGKGGLEEFMEFLWLLACLQGRLSLAVGSPNSPIPGAALARIKTFLSFPGKGFPDPVTAG